jgi:hypothetical protein
MAAAATATAVAAVSEQRRQIAHETRPMAPIWRK